MPEFAARGASAVYRCVTSLTWHGTRHSKSNGSGGSRCLSGPGMTCLVSCERSQCYHEREREREFECECAPARSLVSARSLRESTCVSDVSEDNELLCTTQGGKRVLL
jgi:hypothetical protein